MKAFFSNRKTWIALLAFAGLAGLGWSQRQPVLAWYHVRQLSFAYQENRETCANKVVELDEAAVPFLLAGLQKPDALVCGNMQFALVLLTKKWGVTDARSQRLVERLHGQFDDFSGPGQEK